MLVLRRMALAFLTADPTNLRADLQHRTENILVRAGASRTDSARRGADIGAVEIEADTSAQLRDAVLRETSVRASDAGLRAVEAEFHAVHESAVHIAANVGVSGGDRLYVHEDFPFWLGKPAFG